MQQLDIAIVRKTIRRAGAGRANADGSRARMCEATVGVVSQGDGSEGCRSSLARSFGGGRRADAGLMRANSCDNLVTIL